MAIEIVSFPSKKVLFTFTKGYPKSSQALPYKKRRWGSELFDALLARWRILTISKPRSGWIARSAERAASSRAFPAWPGCPAS